MPGQEPTASQLSAAIRQSFLSGFAYRSQLDASLAPYAYPYSTFLPGQIPPNPNYLPSIASAIPGQVPPNLNYLTSLTSARMGGLGLGFGSMVDPRARAMDINSLTADELRILELAKRS